MNESPLDSRVQASPAACYRRVSTDHQDGSLQVQETRVNDYAHWKHLGLDEGYTFSDPDTSGSIPLAERTGGRALLNRLRHGDIKHLVVAKLDRLGRNARDFLGTFETLFEMGVTLHIVDLGGESISTQGHMGKFILTIFAALAEVELGQIRDRVQQRADHLFANRRLTGNVPYGFTAEYAFADGHIELCNTALSAAGLTMLREAHGAVEKRLLDCPAEQDWIRRIAGWRAAGRSLKAIADELNGAGVVSKQGGRWQCGNVDSLLASRHTARVLGVQTSEL